MNILIIGSEGFIGNNAIDYFIAKNYTVYTADIHLNIQRKNYFLLDANNTNFDEIFKTTLIDICINCSGAANVQLSFEHPILDYQLNVVNVYKILSNIQKYQPKCKFINLSSAAVYGNPAYLPVHENHTANPISPYGFHKLQSEKIGEQFYTLFGIKNVSLRIFSAYGPKLQKQLFWDLYQKCKNNETNIKLFGTGNETRDFIFIDDILQAINTIINNAKFDAEIINVASGKQTSIADASTIFMNIFSPKTTIQFTGNVKNGDPINWLADITKLKKYGFVPNFDIENGIFKYTQWLQKEKK